MSLYDDAQTEYGSRNGSLSITYGGNPYNPYDFVNSAQFNSIYESAVLEQGSNSRVVFRSDADPANVFTMTNSDVISLKRQAVDAVQKLRDGYNYILSQITLGNITTTGQIPTFWNTYNSGYSSGRTTVQTNEQLQNAIAAIPSAVQSDWNQASSGSIDFIKNKPSIPSTPAARSHSSVSRSLNSAFQIHATRDAMVSYSVDISCTISLTTGQTGTVYLEVADDSLFTTNVQEVCRFVNGNSGTLTLGLNLVQAATGTLSGYVPPAKYVRLRTANTTGTPTFTYRSGQEVLL